MDTQTKAQPYRGGAGLLVLEPALQHYPWGDPEFIPRLLGQANPDGRPFAELWMGAHPDAPAWTVVPGRKVSLAEVIRQAPEAILHPAVAQRFQQQLPYLFKVLAAAAPLSLQVHPSKERAAAGFARENAAGVALAASHRNYKDANHKPEVLAALTEFYGLRGFRPLPQLAEQVAALPELRALFPGFQPTAESLRQHYAAFMSLPQERVDQGLGPLVKRLRAEHARRPFQQTDREYWLLRADEAYSRDGHRDRGLVAFYLLNLVRLAPGQAMYLPAGVLHAYLAGAGVELMANSNNVLRGGLTAKHVDVPELLANVVFEGAEPERISARPIPGTGEWVYPTPAEEFELRRIEVAGGQAHVNGPEHSADIVLVQSLAAGERVVVEAAGQRWEFGQGAVWLVPQGLAYTISSPARATLYKATVPAQSWASGVGVSAEPGSTFRGRQPTPLAFGTSGLRGLVTDLTDLEAYLNTRGFLEYLREIGELRPGVAVSVAGDLRPSTDGAERSILRAVVRAIEEAGLAVDYLGKLPTPALTYYALEQGRPSVMVTGSHIPFDRNGLKFNKCTGEVLKDDEPGILRAVARVRHREYARPRPTSLFADDGMFKAGPGRALPPENPQARQEYLRRYVDFFPAQALRGQRLVCYQHSAVGRELLVELLSRLGAEVIAVGRSEAFIPIDTEAITERQLATLQALADHARRQHGPIDAVVSTDGDSDRPLVAGVDAEGAVRFFGGDLLGLVVAEFLKADAVVVPISANDAVDRWGGARDVRVIKTRIGSPYVIAGMARARARGARRVVGWEANGGFLVGSEIELHGRVLKPLPTRDAALPLVAALSSAAAQKVSLVERFARLPARFSKAGLLDQFPLETSRALVRRFSPEDPRIEQVDFEGDDVRLTFTGGATARAEGQTARQLERIRRELATYFGPRDGFAEIARLNLLDGVRVSFRNGDIAHIRPSGNAPQLRIYAVADRPARAEAIVACALAEPDGILRRMEVSVRKAQEATMLAERV